MSHMLRPLSSSDKCMLFCDLDGTLLYSHRHPYDGECVWVEQLHGHPQSFVTGQTYGYFQEQRWLNVIPLTTRNHAQFERLREMTEQLHFPEALICNGAVLLVGMQEDEQWRQESLQLAEPFLPALRKLETLAKVCAGAENVICSDPFLFYVRSADVQTVYRTLSDAADAMHMIVWRDARKVYCIPRVFSKANAARRFCKRVGAARFMAAGDGELDISMLCAAEIGFCPERLREQRTAEAGLCFCGGWFSDTLCQRLEQMRIEGGMV